jgi:hypothetical protein
VIDVVLLALLPRRLRNDVGVTALGDDDRDVVAELLADVGQDRCPP